MNRKVLGYVVLVCCLAVFGIAAVYRLSPVVDSAAIQAAVCFGVLGIFSEALRYRLAPETVGSISFIPFTAVICLTPSWIAITMVVAVVGVSGVFLGQQPVKLVFNVAQHVVAQSIAILTYVALGGSAFVAHQSASWTAYSVMFACFMTSNVLLVSPVIGLSKGTSIWQTCRDALRSSLLYDVLSLPFAFIFAMVYVQYGTLGVVVLAVPLLGARQLYKTNNQLERTNQELLELMVAAIEARDPYTSGHSRRVAHNARVVARALGFSGREVERVGTAALLHDVGKIHEVFAPILRKPGKMTPEERLVMETHPIKSADLVQGVSHLRDLIGPIRHHHENWDGTGYPDGLSTEQIPLIARIIMFADTIDAMTTDRPYRAAMGRAEVTAELQRLRGKQFDPSICDALLASPLYDTLFERLPSATPARALPWRNRSALPAIRARA
jgi:HD domain